MKLTPNPTPNPKENPMLLQMEFDLVIAAGINAGKLSPETVYELAGKIIRDQEISVLAVKEMDASRELRRQSSETA